LSQNNSEDTPQIKPEETAGFKVDDTVAFEQITTENGPQYALYAINGTVVLPEIKDQDGIFKGKHYRPKQLVPWKLPPKPIQYGTVKDLYNETYEFYYDRVDIVGLNGEKSPYYDVKTCFTLATWRIEQLSTMPFLHFWGAKETGKSKGLELLCTLSYRGWLNEATTPAGLFRHAELDKPTLALDECEQYNRNTDFLSLLNARYRKGGVVSRLEKNGNGTYEAKYFKIFGPTILGSTRGFPPSTQSRCLIAYMERKTRDLTPFKFDKDCEEAITLRGKLLQYRFDTLNQPLPEIQIKGLEATRLGELFEPLLQVSPENMKPRLLNYAEQIKKERQREESTSRPAEILTVIVAIYDRIDAKKRLSNDDLIEELNRDLEKDLLYNSRSLGWAMRELGFTPERSKARKTRLYTIDEDKLRRLCERYQVYIPEDSNIQPLHLQKNGQNGQNGQLLSFESECKTDTPTISTVSTVSRDHNPPEDPQ